MIVSLRLLMIVLKSCAWDPVVRRSERSSDLLSDQLRSPRPTQLIHIRSRGESVAKADQISVSTSENDPDTDPEEKTTCDPVPISLTISSIEISTDMRDPVAISAKRDRLS